MFATDMKLGSEILSQANIITFCHSLPFALCTVLRVTFSKETFKTIYLAMTSTKQEDRFKALSSLYLEGGRDSALKTPDKYREARGKYTWFL